jgi:hypothetical protein
MPHVLSRAPLENLIADDTRVGYGKHAADGGEYFRHSRMGLELFKRTMLSGDGSDHSGCSGSGYRGTFQLRPGADFYSNASGLGGTLHHFPGGRVADQRTGFASWNLAQVYLKQARQSKLADPAWMYRT